MYVCMYLHTTAPVNRLRAVIPRRSATAPVSRAPRCQTAGRSCQAARRHGTLGDRRAYSSWRSDTSAALCAAATARRLAPRDAPPPPRRSSGCSGSEQPVPRRYRASRSQLSEGGSTTASGWRPSDRVTSYESRVTSPVTRHLGLPDRCHYSKTIARFIRPHVFILEPPMLINLRYLFDEGRH